MSKSIVIVESPAKAKTINKYLGPDYLVKASLGHLKDLPKKGLGVDIKNNFAPTYEVIPGKEKVLKELKAAARDVEAVYIATDPDREGEAIGWHIAEELSSKKRKVYRVLFNEITRKAIQESFQNPGLIDTHLVDAQQARRILDRLVGYKVSPLLWEKVRRGLSAGRVQSVAVRLVVDRENEIRAFVPKEYWSITAHFTGHNPPPFEARLHKFAGKNIEIVNAAQSKDIVAELEKARYIVEKIEKKEKKRYPVPPFITSKLQQEASRKLRFTVKKTMMLAQRLYEGIEIGGEGSIGLITYMRSDSTRVSDDALSELRQYIGTSFGGEYLPEKAIYYKSKKSAQDAHEAIRPTSTAYHPDEVKQHLSPDEYKLYKLIWQRFLASQMNPALFDQTSVDIGAGKYLFRASGSLLKFDGFLKVYDESKDEKDEEDEELEHTLPPLTEGESLQLNKLVPDQHFTQPPPRFTEATLVKTLEEKGIGRPSTYATILTTIQDREYAVKEDGKFKPTELGFVITDLLVTSFADIFDVQYTARMEEELDEIEEGKLAWTDALREFYAKFAADLEVAQKQMKDIKAMVEPINEVCENCGRPMTLKRGRFGQFLACTGYPECKTTKKIIGTQSAKTGKPDIALTENCPQCGKNLVIKYGRFGEFTACSDYPTCKYIKKKTLGISCPRPNCKGELVEKRSRKGKTFYACDQFPNCDFTAWNKPIAKPCPQCGSQYLLEKTTKKQGRIHYCNNESCDYKESIELVEETTPV